MQSEVFWIDLIDGIKLAGKMNITVSHPGHGSKQVRRQFTLQVDVPIRGYRDAVEAANLPVILDTSVKDYKSAEYSVEGMLTDSHQPDAIFTLKNRTTIYVFETLQKLNISVPGSIALLGYDDFELAAAVRPSISVIQQPIAELGRIAAELLFEDLLRQNSGSGPSKHVRPKQVQLVTRLIRRRSCGCVPAAS